MWQGRVGCTPRKSRSESTGNKDGTHALTETKRCTKCGVNKPRTLFHRNSRTHDGRTPNCADCRNAAHREYIRRPEKAAMKAAWHNADKAANPDTYRAQRYRRKYGIDIADVRR